jgi:glycosyltransferase involved in cell wall biosynthesis
MEVLPQAMDEPLKQNTLVYVLANTPCRIGVAEIFMRELAGQMGQRGWRCVFCYLAPPDSTVREFLALPNVSFEVVEDSWLNSAKAVRQLSGIFRRYRARILHLNLTGFIGVYPWLAKLFGVDAVYFTAHGSHPEGYTPRRAPLWKRVAACIVNAPLTAVICVSEYSRRALAPSGLLAQNRYHVLYNGVDPSRAALGAGQGPEFRRRHGIPAGSLVVTQVSWMIPEKGMQDLLAAAPAVWAAEPRAHFVLAGEGEYRETLVRLADSLGIAPHVTFIGTLVDHIAEGLYAASDVVCQMSRWEEAFGSVITEAMAATRPVVATRAGGIPEIVSDGVTGFLVERGDHAAMAGCILTLLRDPALRARMGEAGLQVVKERFDMPTNVRRLIDLYGIPSPA